MHASHIARYQALGPLQRKRLMNMKVPDHPRMTHAAALQVEVVRQRQALKDKAAARERMEDHCGTLWYYAPELVKGVPFLPVVE